jgi:hypothetical protein
LDIWFPPSTPQLCHSLSPSKCSKTTPRQHHRCHLLADKAPESSAPSVGSNIHRDPPPSPTTAYCIDCDAYHFVGTGDFSSHEISVVENHAGAPPQSTQRSLSASGPSTSSHSSRRLTTLTTSKGCTQTTSAPR